MRPVPSARGTNSSGGIGPCCGCCQRSERLDADDARRSEVGLRLVVDLERAVGDRAPAARPPARGDACCAGCGRRRRSRRPVAVLLRVVHRDVGVLEERGHVGAVRRARPRSRCAARPRAACRSTMNGCWSAVCDARPRSPRPRSRCGSAGSSDDELVAAEPGDRAAAPAATCAMRAATCCSKRSPWWWPSVSLTSLNRLRSMSITATLHPPARLSRSASSVRATKRSRLPRPGERVVQRLVLLLRHLGAQPFDQPRVLDRGADVVRERREHLRVFVVERAHVAEPVVRGQRADDRAALEHGHGDQVDEVRLSAGTRVRTASCVVREMTTPCPVAMTRRRALGRARRAVGGHLQLAAAREPHDEPPARVARLPGTARARSLPLARARTLPAA